MQQPWACPTKKYIQQAAADQALAWQREHDAFRELAHYRGRTLEQLLKQGCLTDETR
ncbi:hypothetical protein ACFRMQ_33490 [Kitasatospora sp. NPDC056783]|uniref:hypothetical protein n=1 Tax=Kitasatospora sp. NPDC056783 TaxID=3345943 RepID=UPI0036C71F11